MSRAKLNACYIVMTQLMAVFSSSTTELCKFEQISASLHASVPFCKVGMVIKTVF